MAAAAQAVQGSAAIAPRPSPPGPAPIVVSDIVAPNTSTLTSLPTTSANGHAYTVNGLRHPLPAMPDSQATPIRHSPVSQPSPVAPQPRQGSTSASTTPKLNGHVLVQHTHQWATYPSQPVPSQPLLQKHQQPPPPSQIRPPDPHVAKHAIMDPPGHQLSTATIQAQGFPSPSLDHATVNPKFVDDVTRMTYGIHQSLPEGVRRVVRDNWEKCLLGSDFHQAFVMNATVHHATPTITKRALRDFGAKMVSVGKEEIIRHFTMADIDDVADLILANASNVFLDKAMDARLRTIEAKPLINALARAERLGYERGDIVEEDQRHGLERVIPQPEAFPGVVPQQKRPDYVHTPPAARSVSGPASAQPHQSPANIVQTPSTKWQCGMCYRVFQHAAAFEHHTKKQVCRRTAPSGEGFKHSCAHCGQGFTTAVGHQYHLRNKVCGDFSTPAGSGTTASSPINIGSPIMNNTPVQAAPTPALASTPSHGIYQQQANMPIPADVLANPSSVPPGAPDPYAHLTPEVKSRLDEELKAAELIFGEKMRAVENISDPGERRARLDNMRNSFGTKQSIIRKRYGVKLRERRTKAEIDAERNRMGLSSKKYERLPNQTTPTTTITPQPPTGWTAANSSPFPPASSHDAKRRKLDGDGSGAQSYTSPFSGSLVDEDRNRKVPALSTMGGLEAVAQRAAMVDLTNGSSPGPSPGPKRPSSLHSASSKQTFTQAGARVEIHEPEGGATQHPFDSQTGTPSAPPRAQSSPAVAASGSATPEAAPIGATGRVKQEDNTPSSEEEESDNDIPASLPPAVLRNLEQSSSQGGSSQPQ